MIHVICRGLPSSPGHLSSTLFPLSLATPQRNPLPLSARSTSSPPPRLTNGGWGERRGTGDIITHTEAPRLLHLSHSSSLSFVLVASGGRAGFKYHRGSIETRVSTCLLDHACYVTRNAVPVPSIDRSDGVDNRSEEEFRIAFALRFERDRDW